MFFTKIIAKNGQVVKGTPYAFFEKTAKIEKYFLCFLIKKTAKIDHPVKGILMLFLLKKMLKFHAQKNLLVFNRKA